MAEKSTLSLVSGTKTCVYKTVGNTQIEIEILLPEQVKHSNGIHITVLLYIHVGGWIAGSRLDYPQTLVHETLSKGWVFASMDHRLLPETSLDGQLEDLRDVEGWLRNDLLSQIDNHSPDADIGDIVVAGGSAGGHLALLTPKLWAKPPTAILSLYGPTNLHQAKGLSKGPKSDFPLPDFTPKFISSITHYDKPPTCIPLFASKGFNQRLLLGMKVIREGVLAEFLLRGLRQNGALALPEPGIVAEKEIDSISPLSIAKKIKYPPTCQIMGTDDDMFDTSHITDLGAALEDQCVPHKELIVSGGGHGFDVAAEIDGEIHVEYIRPAMQWVSQFVNKKDR